MQLIQGELNVRMRAERKRLGYTQVELARLANVSTLTYQQYERGEHEPKVGFINTLGNLGCDVNFLLFGGVGVDKLIPARPQQLEIRAFKLAQEYANKTYGGDFGDEGRFTLFERFRFELERLALRGMQMPESLDAFNEWTSSF